ncbi:hypothetical protein EPA93_39305 [Ktedonosporobacter rubrisoli]|uniref:Rpn family recombination-promoting nuclease/putative transposase n=1 Tax=Ktedonosporobacter rubrisoli TaxID=2509675 RepID=A0A4P6K0I6_KTERU|nr:hypothetical protein [Ktedonosporobacter rubrisoli]QBD81698.1 hypothetical protein EPA93_39305 [Ktedonosporobacter rubrisoli]
MNTQTHKIWDDSLKRLIRANPQHFVSWLLEGAVFQNWASSELKNRTLEADAMLGVVLNGQEMYLHIEFQSKEDISMAQRLLEYNVLATRTLKRPVLSCVLYLRKSNNTAEPPLIWVLPDGLEILSFRFVVTKLWEVSVIELMETGLAGLLPLVPLAKDGGSHEVIDAMAKKIVEARQTELLPLAKLFAGLVLTKEADRHWLERIFAMYNDILEESWVYQEILEKGMAQGLEKGRREELRAEMRRLRAALLAIVQKSYPALLQPVEVVSEKISDPEVLQNLLVKIALAANRQEVQEILAQIPETSKGQTTTN